MIEASLVVRKLAKELRGREGLRAHADLMARSAYVYKWDRCPSVIGAPMAYIAFTTTDSLTISLAAYVVLHATFLAGGPQTFVAVQHITPLQFRGFTSSVLFATITLVSLAIGPLLIGLISDTTGGGGGGLGRAMAIAVVLQVLAGAALLLAARNSFDRSARAVSQMA